jgi:hypothetical protein
MIIIYKAGDITEAHIVKGLLEANDIDAYIGGFYLQGGVGDLAARDFAHVHVADEDKQRAFEIIKQYEDKNYSQANNTAPKNNFTLSKILLTMIIAFSILVVYSLVS